MGGGDERRARSPRGLVKRRARQAGFLLLALLLAPLLGLAALLARVWLGQPDLDGMRVAPGLAGEATIARDEKGVVHIDAASERDAYYALGFAHAQDRFFQMEAMRRIAAGRLAEILGAPVVDLDRRMRTLGIARLATGDVANLSPEALAVYEAYAAGVNAWLNGRKGVAADELAFLLAPEPEPWRPEHSLAWNRLMSLRLAGNWTSELMRQRLGAKIPTELIADLWPDYPKDGAVSITETSGPALAAAAAFARLTNPEDGSNAWAVAGERAASGAPLLANDPHLGLPTPGTGHLVRLRAPGVRLAGASAPGVPAVILGHNGHVAWGLTNASTDTSDVYLEQLDPERPGYYLAPDGPRPFETRAETIHVRFAADQRIVIRSTRHGPIISDKGPENDGGTGSVLALAHVGLLESEGSAEAVYRVNRARAWGDMLAAFKHAKAPQQNAFYAGPDGVGMATIGLLPIRRASDGYMPADGASAAGDWIAFADVSAMPQTFRPSRGWVANANNKIAPDDYPLWLGREWGYPGRVGEIARRLEGRSNLDLDAMQALQYDLTSPLARDLLPAMLRTLSGADLDPTAQALAARLQAWDGQTGMNAAEPLIFFAWVREAVRQIFQDEMGAEFDPWFGLRAEPLERVLSQRPAWCDDTTTEDQKETCPAALAKALMTANAWLIARYGDDPAAWRWGDAHQARFRHLVFGRLPFLNRAFDISLPAPGGQETINRAAFQASNEADPFAQVHGPGLRALYDMADLERSRFVIAPGQSGRLFSPNRSNLAEDWRDGRYRILAPLANPAHVLTLKPGVGS